MKYFFPSSWISSASVALALIGSASCIDILSAPNPQNCVTSASSCAEGFMCSPQTQQCEPITEVPGPHLGPDLMMQDCTADSALCSPAQWCDSESKRCLPQRFVLGQPDERSNLNLAYGMYQPYAARLFRDLANSKTKLAVTDWGNERTLIWNEVPTQNRPADVVLGQQDLMTTNVNGDTPNPAILGTLYTPWAIASNGISFFIAERDWHRISIWTGVPTGSGIDKPLPPTGSWGQPDYLNPRVNAGAPAVHALGLNNPLIFAEPGEKRPFYISDMANHRVLVFKEVPLNPTTPPDFVLGQPDFTSSGTRPVQTGIDSPRGLFSDGTQLFVADSAYHRVVAYDLPITQNEPTPSLVIGQADLLGKSANRGGGPKDDSLNFPLDVVVTKVGGERHLWVSDNRNNRILRFRLPSTKADLVLGHGNFNTSPEEVLEAAGKRSLLSPTSVSTDGVRLVVSDQGNRRVHIWSSLPTENGQPSDVILGQASDFTREQNMPPSMHGLQFKSPTAVTSDGQRLFVADSGNNRVLIWNRIPKDGTTQPDVVLGQPDLKGYLANQDGVSASSLSCPYDVRSDGTRLAVADSCNNRVLVWNQIPSVSSAPADAVLGQPGMSTSASGVSAQQLYEPRAVLFLEGSLLVADTRNNRVLRFDGQLTTSAAATRVIGQPDMSSSSVNANEGRTARSLSFPGSLASDSGRLMIADVKNWRVLLWNRMPSTNFQPADMVIGQKFFNAGIPAPDPYQQLYYAYGMATDAGRLLVSSSWGNRVLIWNKLPTDPGTPASAILGQRDFNGSIPNDPLLPPVDRLSSPMGMAIVNGRLFIADQYNNRVVSRELPQ